MTCAISIQAELHKLCAVTSRLPKLSLDSPLKPTGNPAYLF